MGKPRPAKTLLEVCVVRAGYRRGGLVAQFITEWTIATADLGHELTPTEFARWWRENPERTTWRRLARFREVFPEYETPVAIAAHLIARHDGRRESREVHRGVLLGADVGELDAA